MSPAFQFGVILHQPSGWQVNGGASSMNVPFYRAEIQNDKYVTFL